MNTYPPYTLDFIIILTIIIIGLISYCIYLYTALKNHKRAMYILKSAIDNNTSRIKNIDKEYDRQIEAIKEDIQLLANHTNCNAVKQVKYKTLKDYKK